MSIASIDRLCRDGRIPYVFVGDVRRFDLEAVREGLRASAPGPVVMRTAASPRLVEDPSPRPPPKVTTRSPFALEASVGVLASAGVAPVPAMAAMGVALGLAWNVRQSLPQPYIARRYVTKQTPIAACSVARTGAQSAVVAVDALRVRRVDADVQSKLLTILARDAALARARVILRKTDLAARHWSLTDARLGDGRLLSQRPLDAGGCG